jgi:hypothetical protein
MTSLARSDDKQKDRSKAVFPAFCFYYCSPTDPENVPSPSLACTLLVP